MKIFGSFKFFIVTACFYLITSSKLDLHKIIRTEDYQQITLLTCNNYSKTFNSRVFSFNEYPSKFYDIQENPEQIYDNYYYESKDSKSTYYLQDSLIIYFMSKILEIDLFLFFLIPRLSVRQRPKCLIIFSPIEFDYIHEVQIIYVLNFAWLNKFLDFTIAVTNLAQMKSLMIYHYNPFNDCVFKIQSPDEIFPDKLHNVYGLSLHTNNINFNWLVKHVRGPHKKLEVKFNPYFVIQSAAEILNFTVVRESITDKATLDHDYLEKWNLEFYGRMIGYGTDYKTKFYIPTDEPYAYYIAFVPNFATSQNDVLFEAFLNVALTIGATTIFFLTFRYLKAAAGFITVFDFVHLLFGRKIEKVPRKILQKIIFLTIMVATFKIMNDFLLNILMRKLDEKKMTVDSYEDLYNSKLEVFSILPYRDNEFLRQFGDTFLKEIIRRSKTVSMFDMYNCFYTMFVRKNASCIYLPVNLEYIISYYGDLFGQNDVKFIEPPISPQESGFYWFAEGSPYAMKLLEIIRRVKETSLMHFPALFDKSSPAMTIAETSKVSMNDGIRLNHLLTILSFGYLASIITVVLELITDCVGKIKMLKKIRKNEKN